MSLSVYLKHLWQSHGCLRLLGRSQLAHVPRRGAHKVAEHQGPRAAQQGQQELGVTGGDEGPRRGQKSSKKAAKSPLRELYTQPSGDFVTDKSCDEL